MKKVKFYELSESIDPKIVGEISGDLNPQINGFIDPENTDVARINLYQHYPNCDDYHPDTLDLTRFKADDKANITDLMSSLFLPKAFFISPRLWKILQQFRLNNIRFFDASFSHQGKHYDYKLLNYKQTLDLVDFTQSIFYIKNKFRRDDHVKPKLLNINSYDDYLHEARSVYHEKGFDFGIKAESIVLKDSVDACSFYFNPILYISENLKEALLQENITGIEIEERRKTAFFVSE